MYGLSFPRTVARVVSVNVGEVADLRWEGRNVRTGFVKRPVDGPARLERLGVGGDAQADLRVHGGPGKAVYAYPSEHYRFWRDELPELSLPAGSFGENLTTEGWLETATRSGDKYEVGTAIVEVTVPRLPCYKMDARFGRADMMARFARALRTGFYLAVPRPGEVRTGDPIRPHRLATGAPTIAQLARARLSGPGDIDPGSEGTGPSPDG